MNQLRTFHSSTLLPNGNVLVAGGVLSTVFGTSNGLRSAEIYDPSSDRWSLTEALTTSRATFPSVLLGNNKILVTGGAIDSAHSELYDPIIGNWRVTGSPKIIRTSPTLTVLPNGKALAIGGRDVAAKVLSSVEIFDPVTETWTLSSAMPGFARASHTATLLQNGKVLVVGGTAGSGALRSAELFDSATLSVTSVSAANYAMIPLAPESIASAFGIYLATQTQAATDLPLPTQLADVSVRVTDSLGTERNAPLFYVSPTQINYQIPAGTVLGPARVTISSGATGIIEIAGISPGLFSADSTGTGFAAAVVQRVKSNGEQAYEPIVKFDAVLNRFVASPIDVSDPKEEVFLAVFGTGIRGRNSLTNVRAKVGITDVEVLYAGRQGFYAGVDQVNIRLPQTLSGSGEMLVAMVVDGVNANAVKIQIQ